MKNKFIRFFLYFLRIFLFFILIYFLEQKFWINFIYKNNSDYIDKIITNKTWEITWENTAYKKWDNLEYIFVISRDKSNKSNIDISKLDNSINIGKIELNDKEIKKEDLKNIKLDNKSILKISWTAKLDSDKVSDSDIKVDTIETYNDELTETWITSTWIINFSIKNNTLNSNIDNILEITWTNLDQVDYINIWWISFKPTLKDWNLFTLIEKNTFWNIENFILLKTKSWLIITSDKKIKFTYNNAKVNVSNINPKTIKNDVNRYITIQWNWFSKIISIQLNNNVILKNTEFNIVNDNVMLVKIPSWLDKWEYSLNIMDINNIYEINYMKFLITN